MSEKRGYSPPEAQEEKPEGEGKALKIDRIATRRSVFSGLERSPETVTSSDANKSKQQSMGDNSSQKNDSTTTNSKTQGDAKSANQQSRATKQIRQSQQIIQPNRRKRSMQRDCVMYGRNFPENTQYDESNNRIVLVRLASKNIAIL